MAGIGRARAAQVLAAIELGRRTLVRDMVERPRLTSPRQMAAYLLPEYGSCAVEQFGIVMLDTKHRVIRIKLVSIGSLDSTVVHPREVFREAAAAAAAAIILFHNHPSGDATSEPGRHRPHRTDGQCRRRHGHRRPGPSHPGRSDVLLDDESGRMRPERACGNGSDD